MPYCNVKKFKKKKKKSKIEQLIKHGSHWINFIIFTFIIENNRYFKSLHAIWNKNISFEMKKKG
jgi:hypothetical protein